MFVYILYSKSIDKYYTGQTNNLKDRLHRHNSRWQKHTKKGIPWKLIWYKLCVDRSEAVKLELKIKNRGAKRYLADIEEDQI